ncbi:MAG TPA: SDR family NAD(P)-dependent oxidoreductase [Acetobacteraceae bacterium]|jgi:NAD(P)-dependent dehydrogenase (short-subunit alcohol dehydrogenase family)|nr:SDR family NAD(P)-dependent oxidoreductase [Acetobacteraceae bacterium]
MTNLFDLTGRIAVVTGAAQGMGRAMATALAEAGADLVLLDRNAVGLEATAHAIREGGRKARPIAGDVTDTDHMDQVFATVDREFGRVDVLGNVAGEAKVGAAEHMTPADVRSTFHNLVISRYLTCQLAGRRMLAQGRGSIISIGSIAGVSSLGRAQSVYGMAMAAVIQMTRELSTEWAGRGVRVNCILPAQVLGANGLGPRMEADPWLRDTFLRGIPAGRFGQPDDIKGLAVLLASDAASWITGAAIPMDGGNLAMNAGGGLLAPIMERHGGRR